jgi:hypothetical protein
MNQRSRLTTGFETKPVQWRKNLEAGLHGLQKLGERIEQHVDGVPPPSGCRSGGASLLRPPNQIRHFRFDTASPRLGQQFGDHLAANVSQALIAALETER